MPGYDASMSSMSPMTGYDESMMGGMMGMGMGMVPQAKPQPPEVLASRRRINYVLQQFLMGATGKPDVVENPKPAGLLTTVNEADKAEVDQWIKTVGEVVGKVNDETLDDRKKFVLALTEQVKLLRELSGVVVEEEAGAAAVPGAAAANDALGAPAAPLVPGAAIPGAALPGAVDPAAMNPAALVPGAAMPPAAPNAAAPNAGAARPAVVPGAVAPAPAGVAPAAIAPGAAAPGPAVAPPAPAVPAAPGPAAPAATLPGIVPPAAPAE